MYVYFVYFRFYFNKKSCDIIYVLFPASTITTDRCDCNFVISPHSMCLFLFSTLFIMCLYFSDPSVIDGFILCRIYFHVFHHFLYKCIYMMTWME